MNQTNVSLPRGQAVGSESVAGVRTSALVALLIVAAFAALQFTRHFTPGSLDPDGKNWVQAARQFARTGKPSTEIVLPLQTACVAVNGDGTIPDFGHGPLYLALVGCAMRATHQIGAGLGEREAILCNALLYVLGAAATYGLCHLLCAGRAFAAKAALIAVLFFALGGMAASAIVIAHPALLGALIFTLLLMALFQMDTPMPEAEATASPGHAERRARTVQFGYIALAGVLYGLLFLTLYSSLLLLPALLVYLYRTIRIHRPSRVAVAAGVALFLTSALLIASALLVRNFRLAHNAFYNSHLTDLLTNTASYPGYGLWSQSVQPKSLSQYLSNGGLGEVVAKSGANLLGSCGVAPAALGLLVLPLFALSALSRFSDPRVGRLRVLVYVCIGCHMVGLSPYLPFAESAPILLIYAPFAAALSAGYLLTLIAARRLPAFYALSAQVGWTAIAALPGLAQIAAPPADPASVAPFGVYAFLGQSDDMGRLRKSADYLTTDAPAEAAFQLDLPVVALPVDGSDMQTVTNRTGRRLGAVLLTPDFARRDPRDPATALWLRTYHDIIALSEVSARLDARTSRTVVKYTHLFYPPPLAVMMAGFRPAPYSEPDGAQWSLLFWPIAPAPRDMARPTAAPRAR